MRHGTANSYWHRRCRCDPCRQAANTYQREWRRRRREADGLDIPDEIAVERATFGDRDIHLTRLEVAEAFAYLNAHDHTAGEIAARLGVSCRTVYRWRAGATVLPFSRPARKGAA